MAETNELKGIKKLYGEKFMHLCRELFPTLLEKEGLLTQILTSSFSTNGRTLCQDIEDTEMLEDFKDYIYSKVDVEKNEPEIIIKKSPYELLNDAGYDLYECTSEEEIQSFKKYYSTGEELCTFNGGRLNRCVVFWAVKRNANEIKRENFEHPQREDEYGTSVMGIQFSKEGICTVSIKNRYNHTVNNPDATYGNDLDRIIPGLTQSFAELLSERGLEFCSSNRVSFNLPGYTVAGDGKYYKYNNEVNGIYYCPGNIIIDHGNVIHLEPEKQVLIDCFILDKTNKTIKLYDKNIGDCFVDAFDDIDKIEMKKSEDKQGETIITITQKNSENPITITINKDNQIVGYDNQELKQIGDDFLKNSNGLRRINIPNVKEVGNNICCAGTEIQELYIDSLEKMGNNCFPNCQLTELDVTKLRQMGNRCFTFLYGLYNINFPNLERIGDECFESVGEGTIEINFPRLTTAGDRFLKYPINPNILNILNIERLGDNCLEAIYANLHILSMPKLKKVGDNFLKETHLEELDLPMLEQTGDKFLLVDYHDDVRLKELRLPNLRKIGDRCLGIIMEMDLEEQVDLPNIEQIGDNQQPKKIKEILSAMISYNVDRKNTEQKIITPKKIAQLDQEQQLTTSELSIAEKIIRKVKSIFKREDKNALDKDE